MDLFRNDNTLATNRRPFAHLHLFSPPMITALLYGLLTGLGLSWTFGTVFFVLIQTSLEKGWQKGILIASGVAFSDILFILLAVGGVSFVAEFVKEHESTILIIGGCMLIALGIRMFFKKNKQVATMPKTSFANFMFYFSTGVLLNILNPINFFSWIAISTATYQIYSSWEMFVFFTGCTITIFTSQVLIAYSAHSLKRFFTEKLMKLIDIGSGCVFCGIGIYMIIQAIR